MSNIREKILKAANTSLEERDLAELQINELCQLANVSRTSFYREFKNLDDLGAALATQIGKDILREAAQAADTLTDPRERLFQFIRRVATDSQSHRFLRWEKSLATKLIQRENGLGLAVFFDVLGPVITRCQQDGALRGDLRTEEIADWLLRQWWLLSNLPLRNSAGREALDRYIQVFIVDALRPADASGSGSEDVHNKLDQILDKLRYL
ncbi:TetR/AcrR family transcriptional regulator [Spongiibacter nanhainus]|uniref:TetR/AcrR family transcriptional regulator n=1 Tax=Spongiibacter nanhainus TaxID=2794344 RepID=A0A7T4QZ06_9GAMM|nr:TetR/AcrR family transcriptional regulator [Spongiibacter nanhainus]QQD17311.1 TetR/AcrR family transcriptional regulator [Spongiibacter nanhainus]